MKSSFGLGRQIGDFLTYIFLPVICVLLPYRWGQHLLLQVANRGWLLQSRSELALEQARRFVAIGNENTWKSHWRVAEMMEARDLWLCVVGRSGSISRRIRIHDMPQARIGLVLLGMHYGPTAIVLEIFRQAGLGPRFVYRGIDRNLRRLVPFQWLYSKLNVKYIRQSCEGREISVPGARSKLQAALGEVGSPVILLDAPVNREGQSIHSEVLGLNAEFSGEGPALLAEGGASCVHYWMELNECGERDLHFGLLGQAQSAEQLVAEFTALMSRKLLDNSAHWRLWHAADQLFRSQRETTESAAGS